VAELAFALRGLGHPEQLLEAAERAQTSSRWLEAARAVALDELACAAELYAAIGSLPDELVSRLGVVQQAVARGDRAQAETNLGRLLPAFEQLGAERYLEDGEQLLAATAEPSG
jgi:hypothetical protein